MTQQMTLKNKASNLAARVFVFFLVALLTIVPVLVVSSETLSAVAEEAESVEGIENVTETDESSVADEAGEENAPDTGNEDSDLVHENIDNADKENPEADTQGNELQSSDEPGTESESGKAKEQDTAADLQINGEGQASESDSPIEVEEETRLADSVIMAETELAVVGETITIPYGVDIGTWLCGQDIYNLDVSEVQGYFSDATPLLYQGSAYPAPGASVAAGSDIVFNTTTFDDPLGEVSIDSDPFSGVSFVMSDVLTYYPSSNLLLRQGGALIDDPLFDGIGAERRLWFATTLGRTITTADPSKGALIELFPSESLSLEIDGQLSATSGTETTDLTLPSVDTDYPAQYYYRAKEDITLTLEETRELIDADATEPISFSQGQIFALPRICVDVNRPSFSVTWFEDAGHSGTQEKIFDGGGVSPDSYRLYTDAFIIKIKAEDVGDVNTTLGIKSVAVQYGGQPSTELSYNSESGTWDYRFADDGDYYLSTIRVTVTDNVGNVYTAPLTNQKLNNGDTDPLDPVLEIIRISTTTTAVAAAYQGAIAEGNQVENGGYANENSYGYFTIEDRTLASLKQSTAIPDSAWPELATIYYEDEPSALATFGLADFNADSWNSASLTLSAPFLLDKDGRYTLKVSYLNPSNMSERVESDEVSFILDKTKPRIAQTEWKYDNSRSTVVNDTLFTPSVTLIVTPEDTFVGGSVSGVEECKFVCKDSAGNTYTPLVEKDENGMYTVRFTEEAYLHLSDIKVRITDKAGNIYFESLKDYYARAENNDTPPFDALAIVLSRVEAGFTYNNKDLTNGSYLKKRAAITVTIVDPYFESALDAYNALDDAARKKAAPVIKVSYHASNKEKLSTNTHLSIPLDAGFKQDKNNPDAWTYTFSLKEEGYYALSLHYRDLCNEPYVLKDTMLEKAEFCIDTTDPVFEKITFTPDTPAQWGWICAPAKARLEIELSDNLSGVDPKELFITVGGQDYPASYDEGKRVLSAEFDAEDQRISFASIKVKMKDKAGNTPEAIDVLSHENKNFDAEQISHFLVDSAAPRIKVSYDNNSFQNDRYYAAARMATVEITEASFDLVKKHDPYRVIVTKKINGNDVTNCAKDFENPSGDGITWVLQVPCDVDGDYTLSASFTDPSGKKAEPYQESFVVDATKPLIMINFDNNEAESGSYYKAPRTATITIYDRNFSQDLTSVSTQARDEGGTAVEAPGISGWHEAKENQWQTTVYFGQELHYELQVTCTDLAGNVADEVTEPEFIIDMTAPIVVIDEVSNYTAYAHKIAPRIRFEDTNFERYLCSVDIRAASKSEDEYVYLANEETETGTSLVLDYLDIDYSLIYDDIYTMHALIKDKAGNTAEQTVTFSVNRFGSNYYFTRETKPYVDTHLKESHDIVVVETNVSGLESSKLRMAKNDEARALSADDDYQVEAAGSDVGWSQYYYTLPAKLFEDDGYYRVILTSHDLAGNYSESLMEGKNETRDGSFEVSFAVDGTAPVASMSNIEANTAYYAPSQRVDIIMSDNLEAETASLIVNGACVQDFDANMLMQDRVFSYELPASEGIYSAKLEIKDRAGNTSTTSLRGVVVTNDLIRYILNTPEILYPLLAGTILGMGLLIILIGRFIVKRKEKIKKETERTAQLRAQKVVNEA